MMPTTWAAEGEVRVESEFKLSVPESTAGELWLWLQSTYPEECTVGSLSLHCTHSIEHFFDTYFDNSEGQLALQKNGVRHRRRLFPDDTQTELIQIKASGDSEHIRQEVKFDVRSNQKVNTMYDDHPLLRLIRRSDRDVFVRRLMEYGINAFSLRPLLNLSQERKRIYISDAEPMITITFDAMTSRKWWVRVHMYEIEIEINEQRYTNNPQEGEYLYQIQAEIFSEITKAFPDIVQNQRPKYTQVFDKIFAAIPWGKTLLSWDVL
ncbi:MAG TPA: hypothetical protein VI873_03685 [Candidatus Peribacteraceae bacterium]|nr:hypothetical protein [Candidatus Peribacteraceae bacterium]